MYLEPGAEKAAVGETAGTTPAKITARVKYERTFLSAAFFSVLPNGNRYTPLIARTLLSPLHRLTKTLELTCRVTN